MNYQGKSSFSTLGGGVTSLGLRIIILTYFVIQLLKVWQYQAPQINGYSIIENRLKQEEPLNFEEHHTSFYFTFVDQSKQPVLLEPFIGSF